VALVVEEVEQEVQEVKLQVLQTLVVEVVENTHPDLLEVMVDLVL
jgi:hypothetical protein